MKTGRRIIESSPMIKLLAFLLVLGTVGCVRGPARQNQNGEVMQAQNPWSGRREAEMGREIHQAIVASFRTYTEPRLVGYVTRIGRSLARAAERQDLTYQFTILYDDRVYATQAPGGYVYLTTGFLGFLQNEAELAAALAHEIGELQYRDPNLSISRQALRLAAEGGAIAAPLLGPFGMIGAGGLVMLHALLESRTATPEARVKKADRLALHYLVETDRDPQGYVDLLSRFLNRNPEWMPYCYDYLQSRPVTLERFQAVLAEFEKLPLEGKSFSVNRDRYLEMTKGVREIYQR